MEKPWNHITARLAWAGVALALLTLLVAAWRLSADALWFRFLIVTFVALASWRPRDGLLVLAGLGPVIGVYGAVAGAPFSMRELIVLATCAGWALHVALVPPRAPLLPHDLRWPLLAATVVVVTSLAVELYGQRVLMGPATFGDLLARSLDDGLLRHRQSLRGLDAGLMFLEGLAIFAAATALCARRPPLVRQAAAMAVAGAAGAAMINIQRLVIVAQASPAPLERLRELVTTVRLNVGYGDVNAAGSYFALLFFPAAALAVHAHSWRRLLWSGAVAAIFAAAWLSGSRAAVGAIIAVLLLATILLGRRPSSSGRVIAAALAATILAGSVFLAAFPNQVFGQQTPVAIQIRVEMARISLAILAAEPVFGVGIGGFYEASAPLLASSSIGRYYAHENAHNNALQWLAELGIVGFAAVAWLVWRAARRIAAAVSGPAGSRAAGLGAGLVAFALTAMLGHPLLTPEVNHAFWLVLGIACGAAPERPRRAESHAARGAALLVLVLAIGALPWRIRDEVSRQPLEHVRYGASVWHTDADGVRYQTFTQQTTLFVPSTAQAVDIPLRLHVGDAPALVEIRFRNRVADRVPLSSASWTTYRLVVGSARGDLPYLPVDVHVAGDDTRPIRIGRTVVR